MYDQPPPMPESMKDAISSLSLPPVVVEEAMPTKEQQEMAKQVSSSKPQDVPSQGTKSARKGTTLVLS
jgi:hypothetical protein